MMTQPFLGAPVPRVLVTGIGIYSALGNDRESSWENLRLGKHGCRFLDQRFDPASPEFAGFPVRHSDHRANEILVKAAMEATRDASLSKGSEDPDRVATVVGMSKGDLRRRAAVYRRLIENPIKQPLIEPWTSSWPNIMASVISHVWNFRGPCLAPVAACATGLIAAIQGADLIQRGVCDVAVVGAGDSSLELLVLGSFRKMGVLAQVEGDPGKALRPWDKNRSGFLVGEGAALFVLEREEHALARGVKPYAEFAGGVFGADAFHMTNLNPDPSNLAGLIQRALRSADVEPSEIDHVNVHGTATAQNDPLECRAIRLALGTHADRVSCSANKAQIGHCLGAAGALELAFTCLAVRDGFIPPTLNLDDPDPACDLDATPHVGRSRDIHAALKLSIGFGGHLAAAVVRKYEGGRRHD